MLRAVIATLLLAGLSVAAISQGAHDEEERLSALTGIAIAGSPKVVAVAGRTHAVERMVARDAPNGGTWAAAATAHQQIIALEAGRQVMKVSALASGAEAATGIAGKPAATDVQGLGARDTGGASGDWASELVARDGDPQALVRGLQVHLAALGCYRARVDGAWGPASRAAFRRAFSGVATPQWSGEIDAELVLALGSERARECSVGPGGTPGDQGVVVASNASGSGRQAAGDERQKSSATSVARTRSARLQERPSTRRSARARLAVLREAHASRVQIVRVTRATRYGLGVGSAQSTRRAHVVQVRAAPRSTAWMARAFRTAN